MEELYFVSQEDFMLNHPETIPMKEEIRNKRYDNYEEMRKKKIETIIKFREELLKAEEEMEKEREEEEEKPKKKKKKYCC